MKIPDEGFDRGFILNIDVLNLKYSHFKAIIKNNFYLFDHRMPAMHVYNVMIHKSLRFISLKKKTNTSFKSFRVLLLTCSRGRLRL